MLYFIVVTFAATAIYCYWWVMPTLLYMLLLWRGNHAGLTYMEVISVYGYSLAVYVPISVSMILYFVTSLCEQSSKLCREMRQIGLKVCHFNLQSVPKYVWSTAIDINSKYCCIVLTIARNYGIS